MGLATIKFCVHIFTLIYPFDFAILRILFHDPPQCPTFIDSYGRKKYLWLHKNCIAHKS